MMNRYLGIQTLLRLCILGFALLSTATFANSTFDDCSWNDCLDGIQSGRAGFLLVAPDRGYAGNQKIRASFAAFDKKHNAQLIFMTDERTLPYLQTALEKLHKDHAEKIVILPLFYSTSHPKLTAFRLMLKKLTDNQHLTFARAFGNSYLAVEMLSERLKEIESLDAKTPLLLVTQGAKSEKSFKIMQRDFKRIADAAIEGLDNKKIELIVLPDGRHDKDYQTLKKAAWDKINKLATEGITQALPFHLGMELDGMMSVNEWTKSKLPDSIKMVQFTDNEVEFFSLWMQREANRYLSSQEAPLGIVFNAHGSDFHWNQGMRDAVKELTKKYPVEFAFSMADSEDLRQAVQRLEKRGVGVIVIVRVFGMRASFRHRTERLIGLDIDAPELCKTEEKDDKHEGELPPRLKTTALVVTEGGLGDSSLFAQAMLDRAKALSENMSKETVIVVAHGKGTDSANQQWLNVLDSLVKKMKANGGDQFKAIYYQTWQEDWEDKRGDRINAVLKMVNDANDNGGSAIIIPARTTGKGRAKAFLKDAKYKASKGFAPHPLFPKWIEQQLIRGVETIKQTRHIWYPALPKEN